MRTAVSQATSPSTQMWRGECRLSNSCLPKHLDQWLTVVSWHSRRHIPRWCCSPSPDLCRLIGPPAQSSDPFSSVLCLLPRVTLLITPVIHTAVVTVYLFKTTLANFKTSHSQMNTVAFDLPFVCPAGNSNIKMPRTRCGGTCLQSPHTGDRGR